MKRLFVTLFFLCSANLGFSQVLELEDAVSSKYLAQGVKSHKEMKYEITRGFYTKALDKSKVYSPDFFAVIYNIVVLELDFGLINQAESLLKKGLELSGSELGEDHPKHAIFLSAAAFVYQIKSEFDSAAYCHLKALAIYDKHFGKQSKKSIDEKDHLAFIYLQKGNYQKAELIYTEIEPLYTRFYSVNSNEYIALHKMISILYFKLGNFEKSKNYTVNLINHLKDAPPSAKNTKEIEELLDSLETMYPVNKKEKELQVNKNKGTLNKNDKELIDNKLKQFKIDFGELSTEYIGQLMYASVAYGDFDKRGADSLLHIALNLENAFRGNMSFTYFTILSLLAYNDNTSIRFNEALKANENIYGKLSPSSIGLHKSLLKFYETDLDKAEYHTSCILQILQNEMQAGFSFLTETERDQFWQANAAYVKYSSMFSTLKHVKKPSFVGITYDCELFTKSLLLNSSLKVQQSIYDSHDAQLIKSWNDLKTLKKQTISEKRNEELEVLEKTIINKSQIFQKQQKEFILTWEDIRKALHKDDVAIEFVDNNSSSYVALILRPDYKYPKMVFLANGNAIAEALKQSPHDAKYAYPLVWKPLEKYLEGVQTIYLAPTGVLHNVSFAGMKTENGYLSDHFAIHNMLSTKDLISLKGKAGLVSTRANNALLMGGADFNLPNDELASLDVGKEQKQNLTRGELDELDPTRGQGFDYLPGAKKEVERINQLLTQSQCITALFTDKYATESQFKASIARQAPDLIHISTHGFYFPKANPNSENKYRTAEKPLLRSGLAFAGANSVWSGKQVSDVTDDGILTAYEISNLDLINTKLVVLSACETGLGDIRGSEGVYGLQRAFRLAGVQSLIVSLWKVSDVETVIFMTEFYTQWTKKMSVKEAFTKAQNKMKTQYVDQPEKWAGFVLVE